jgi:hypothetical protein
MIGFPQRPQNENSGQPSPTTISSSRRLISFLQLSHFLTSIGEKESCGCGLELCDAALVLLQLVFVPAELFGAYGVLLLERLDSFHDAV